jgi:methyl-accepting chemotaxis protein
LSQATVEVSALSASFSDASIKISQSAMEEAAQMEQTASSINQVNEQANISLQKVEKIAKLSQETKQCAENGSQAISEMFGAIVAIDDSSKKVAQVIKTINDIAFQTNILALNAAVEAARAGESGRGFAVVAAEVRNLASRTSEAAISSTDMIQENLKNTKAGIEISTKVGEFLMGIMDHTDGMVEMLSQFDGAMKEQTTNVNQITATVNQCSQTIQQNAASIEENSNSAGALTDQVNIFKELLLELERVLSQRERYFASQEAVAPDAVLELPGGAALSEETAT